jgi:hypothetical protein
MARRGTFDRTVEAQYRNLAIATEIIAAKRRAETKPPLPKLDPKELVSISGAVRQNGSLAALAECKAVTEPSTKLNDRPPSGTSFLSSLAKVTATTKSSLDTLSSGQTFGWQERIELLLWNLEPREVPPSYLNVCSRTSLVKEENAFQNSETEIVPVVKFPNDPRFIWKQKSCHLPLSHLGSSSRTSVEEKNAAFQDTQTEIVPIVKFPNDQCSVRPHHPTSRSNDSPIPASRHSKPAFVLLDLCLEATDSAFQKRYSASRRLTWRTPGL